MSCAPSTHDEEDGVIFPIRNAINQGRAEMLLYLQDLLVRARLRGDASQLTEWVRRGDLAAEVTDNAEAIGVLVSDEFLEKVDQRLLELKTGDYRSLKDLDGRDFLSKEIASGDILGTCCAIGDRKILTAGHVLDDHGRLWLCKKKLCVLFGFATQIDGQARAIFDPKIQKAMVKVPEGVNLEYSFEKEWLELDIDRSMSDLGGRRHALVSKSPLKDGAPVYTLGHPNGLSLRYALSPTTVPGPEATCFRAFVDGYGVASGSPVFDASSHEIVGIAVASGQKKGTVRITKQDSLSQVCTPLTSRGVSCLRRPFTT